MIDFVTDKYDLFQFIAILHQFYLKDAKISQVTRDNIKSKWILKVLKWEWYTKIYVREISHYLADTDNPTDDELKPPRDALKLFLEADWDATPFTIITANQADLPQELVFTPPQPTKLELKSWTPVSTETHQSYAGGLDVVNRPVTSRVAQVNELISYWKNILVQRYQYNPNDVGGILFDQFKKDKNNFDTIIRLSPNRQVEYVRYQTACILLALPMWYRLDKEMQQTVCNSLGNISSSDPKGLMHYIDDIWNVFSNRLPVDIKIFERIPV
jgi:hypothetical protein